MKKKIKKPKGGYIGIDEWVRMIHTGEIDTYMRKHKASQSPCPPYDLISSDTICTYCTQCHRDAVDEVKVFKNFYRVYTDKFQKEDLDKIPKTKKGDV